MLKRKTVLDELERERDPFICRWRLVGRLDPGKAHLLGPSVGKPSNTLVRGLSQITPESHNGGRKPRYRVVSPILMANLTWVLGEGVLRTPVGVRGSQDRKSGNEVPSGFLIGIKPA